MSHQFTRQQLYDMVWAEPMSRLAAKLGISDVALTKSCRRGKVPTPERGYWAKLRHGKAVDRPALPALGPEAADTVIIEPQQPVKSSVPRDLQDKVRAEQAAQHRIVVAKSLRNAHPIVRRVLQKISGKSLPIERRRLRIMSTLFIELERRGYSSLPDTDRQRNARVKVGEEIIEFRLKERHTQSRVRLRPEERRFSWESEWRRELHPTGQLVFSIETWIGDGLRKQWRDTKSKQLEDQLNDIITGLVLVAASLYRWRVEREERERVWRTEEERRRELEEARRKRQEELQGLLREVDAWQRANQIRDYVHAKLAAMRSCPEAERWAAWASRLADEIDPLKVPGAGDRI